MILVSSAGIAVPAENKSVVRFVAARDFTGGPTKVLSSAVGLFEGVWILGRRVGDRPLVADVDVCG